MTITSWAELQPLYERAYHEAVARSGDLRLNFTDYAARLDSVLKRYLPPAADHSAALAFVEKLHTTDLYLATACALTREGAWERFYLQYGDYIERAAARVSSNRRVARDLADNLAGHLCLLDPSGRKRIASYDGRSALTTWLMAILHYQALKEARRQHNHLERLGELPEMADPAVIKRIENDLRAHQYEPLISDAFAQASQSLSTRERLILRLRYEDGLDGAGIARLLGVHPSTVTRSLQASYEKLRQETLAALALSHRLHPASLEECIMDILENPGHALLPFISHTG